MDQNNTFEVLLRGYLDDDYIDERGFIHRTPFAQNITFSRDNDMTVAEFCSEHYIGLAGKLHINGAPAKDSDLGKPLSAYCGGPNKVALQYVTKL